MNREQLHALLTQAKAIVHHTDFVIVGSLSILGAVSELPAARKRMVRHRKALKLT